MTSDNPSLLVDRLRTACWEIQDDIDNGDPTTLEGERAVSVAQDLMNAANDLDRKEREFLTLTAENERLRARVDGQSLALAHASTDQDNLRELIDMLVPADADIESDPMEAVRRAGEISGRDTSPHWPNCG